MLKRCIDKYEEEEENENEKEEFFGVQILRYSKSSFAQKYWSQFTYKKAKSTIY